MYTKVTESLRDKRNMLDSFFPFDPYLLKKSSSFVTPIYQEWKGIDGDDELIDKDDNDNNETEQEEKKNDSIMQFSMSPNTPRFDYCISPGFHPDYTMKPGVYEE